MRFLLDEDVNPRAAVIARGLELDVVSVHELGRYGLDDSTQLRLAAVDGRILVTRNRNDFIRLTVEWSRIGRTHPGVLVVPHTIPNRQPERISHALLRWYEHQVEHGDPGPGFLDFLAS
jgi:predicted nuclease of predicted toxin-antitoxin system